MKASKTLAHTNAVEQLFAGNRSPGTFFKQTCPMAFGGKGGTWFSDVKEIENAYRDDMRSCGSVVTTFEQ